MTSPVSTTNAELLEELALVRSGKPFHVHRDNAGKVVQVGDPKVRFCTSPYCVDLSAEGYREGPHHA